MYHTRVATTADVGRISTLIEQSVRGLSRGFYTDEQVASALRYVFGPDTQLIADRTYFVIEIEGSLVASGGWSRRRTHYGGDQMKDADDPLIDPATEPARIRAFFVHPEWSRRGLGRQLFETCMSEARAAGFRRLELVATMPGEPLYAALGFAVRERLVLTMPNGVALPLARMSRDIDQVRDAAPAERLQMGT